MIKKYCTLMIVLVTATCLYADAKLPLLDNKRVKGIDVLVNGNWDIMVSMHFINRNGDETECWFMQYDPYSDDFNFTRPNPCAEYYFNYADRIPILSKRFTCNQKKTARDGTAALRKLYAIQSDCKRLNKERQQEKIAKANAANETFNRIGTLFGYKLAAKFDPSATNSTIQCDSELYTYNFTPDKKFRSFSKYQFMVTPTTRRIFHIEAMSESVSKEEIEIVKQSLETKYGIKMKYDMGTWFFVAHAKNGNNRILQLSGRNGKTTISLGDDYGLKQAEKEAGKKIDDLKHKEIMKSIDAL